MAFAVHPLQVESVAWVSERKDVLSGLFFMLILLVYPSYARPSPSRVRRISYYLLLLLLLTLGLAAKSMLISVPCVLLLLDYWPLARLTSADDRTKALTTTGHVDDVDPGLTPRPR